MEGKEMDGAMVTEWLDPSGYCGRTGYGSGIRTNFNWCRREVGRLAVRGIQASIETGEDGMIAIFRR